VTRTASRELGRTIFVGREGDGDCLEIRSMPHYMVGARDLVDVERTIVRPSSMASRLPTMN
jgi:hypothetical protein